MIVIKRRLIFWLLRAYLKKWGRILLLCFLLGLGTFFVLKFSFPYILAAFTGVSKETDGMVGIYTLNSLPDVAVQDVSRGLTKIDDSGNVKPDLAQSWDIKDSGKTYVFHLKKGITFVDGTELTSKDIQFSFSDVKVERQDDQTISFTLKDVYSPFLATVSRPVFKRGYVGVGPYRIKNVVSSGSFIQSLTLTSTIQNPALKIYVFYPTPDSLKVAFTLGEITKALNLPDISFQNTSFDHFPHSHIVKSTNYSLLVALFYNTGDKNLSDKKLRDALSYSLPDTFLEGERANSSIPPYSQYYNNDIQRVQDLTHAKLLLDASIGNSDYPTLTISTLPKYKQVALLIQKSWKAVGIPVNIQLVDSLPPVFQIYLGDFTVSKDPDQYTLWHSFQGNNITGFKSTRIDTLLEDGRKTIDVAQRIKTYQDFQKYLQDEQPASFLYFPYNYEVSRK